MTMVDNPKELVYDGGQRPLVVSLRDGVLIGPTTADLAALFGVDATTITRHAKSILSSGELLPAELNAENAFYSAPGRPAARYTLDAVVAIGYRVNSSPVATAFRRWATTILADHIRAESGDHRIRREFTAYNNRLALTATT